nr:MAG TPA: hypothetical protein [Caudoviricetes sp.]
MSWIFGPTKLENCAKILRGDEHFRGGSSIWTMQWVWPYLQWLFWSAPARCISCGAGFSFWCVNPGTFLRRIVVLFVLEIGGGCWERRQLRR